MHSIYTPDPRLKNYISHYMVLEINVNENHVLCSYPDSLCIMCLFYSNELPEYKFRDKTVSNLRCFLSGLLNSGVQLQKKGSYGCILVFFTPLGNYELFGIPPSEYKNNFVPIVDLIGRSSDKIIEKVCSSNATTMQINYLNDFFLEFLNNRNCEKYIFKSMVNEFFQKSGTIKIDEIMKKFDISGRKLDRVFQSYFGVTPKHYSRLIRLGIAYKMLMSKNYDVQDVVYRLKYYDQAHLIHDFNKYSDITPSDLIRNSQKTIFPLILSSAPENEYSFRKMENEVKRKMFV